MGESRRKLRGDKEKCKLRANHAILAFYMISTFEVFPFCKKRRFGIRVKMKKKTDYVTSEFKSSAS